MIFAVGLGALRARVERFRRDKRGAIAMLFALAILPLLFLVGLAVDFRTLQTARSDLQNALDSALLAAARTYNANSGLSETQRQEAATAAGTAIFTANLKDAGPPLTEQSVLFTFNDETNLVTATGSANSATAFGGLMEVFGGDRIDVVRISVYGEAQGSDPRRVEVVLALDTTGSMFDDDRMILMRAAAMNFVQKLFEESEEEKLYIGVVPWTTTVNINMEEPIEDWDASGEVEPDADFDGTRALPPTPFQDFRSYVSFPQNHHILTAPSTTNATDLATWPTLGGVAYDPSNPSHVRAFDALFAPTTWRGCIRAAANERSVNGSGTVTAALTDEMPNPKRWQLAAVEPTLQAFGSSGSAANRVRCGTSNSTNQNNSGYNAYFDKPDRTCYTSNSGGSSTTTVAYTTTSPQSYRAACLSDANEFAYLATHGMCAFKPVTIPHPKYNDPYLSGPNVNCVASMLGLSGNKVQILNALNRMYANSDGTQQDIGLTWGLRMLSPRNDWKNFFGHTGLNAPADWDTDETRKVLILLTDGDNNVPSRWEGYWGCGTTSSTTRGNGNTNASGACWKSPNIPGTLNDTVLDNLTRDACDAIRDTYHVELYTIAVDVTNGDAIDLLSDCAGNPGRAFNIDSSQINATFVTIANSALRLTK